MNNTKEMTMEEVKRALGYDFKLVTEHSKTLLRDIKVGKTFKIGEFEFIVLEHSSETTAVILKDFWIIGKFDGDSNDYRSSSIRCKLNNDFYNKLTAVIGKENIVEHTVDLTSDDGRKEYGKCRDFVSILTCNSYRRYVDILDKYSPKRGWWLVTPYSTKDFISLVRYVNNYGALFNRVCNGVSGVRPFCILQSNILVSK